MNYNLVMRITHCSGGVRMKKSIIRSAFAFSLAFLLSSCLGGHSIRVVSGEKFLDKCPKRAKAGESVTLTTVTVCDGNLYVNGNVDFSKKSDSEFEFVMPDYDVEIKITVIANGLS